MFGPAIGQDFLDGYQRCSATGETVTIQQTFPDGDRTLYFQAHLTPLFDAQGQITRMVGNATDITERKAVELALKASKTRYRSLAQQEKLVNNISQQIRKSLDLKTLLDSTVQALYELLDVDRCYVLLYNEDSQLSNLELATEAKREDLPSRLEDYHSSFFELLNQLLQKRHSIRVDQAADIEDSRLRHKVNQLGYQSLLLFPINSGDGTLGTLAVAEKLLPNPGAIAMLNCSKRSAIAWPSPFSKPSFTSNRDSRNNRRSPKPINSKPPSNNSNELKPN